MIGSKLCDALHEGAHRSIWKIGDIAVIVTCKVLGKLVWFELGIVDGGSYKAGERERWPLSCLSITKTLANYHH